MSEIKPIKGMWVCVNSIGEPIIDTLSYYKKTAMKKLIADTQNTWDYWNKEYGFEVVKVNITFTKANK